MSKQVLDVHQMQHLQELGMDTSNASMCWIKDTEGNQHLSVHDEYCYETSFMNPIPAYTLQDVLDALPNYVIDEEGNKYYLLIEMMNTEFDDWRVSYKSSDNDESQIGYFQAFQLIDAAVRMLVLCAENGYVKTNRKGWI